MYEALAKMTQKDPQKGSFRTYSRKAFGRSFGFLNGWVYWFSEMLIMGSQLTALSLFSRFWFPDFPLWVFAAFYGGLGLVVIIIGSKLFEPMENISAIVKVSAILMFVIIVILGLSGVIDGKGSLDFPSTVKEVFPTDWKKTWSSLVYAFFAFGGIEVLGIMSMRLEKKEDAPKAGRVMIFALTIIYIVSLGLVVMMLPWNKVNLNESPFLTVLNYYPITFIPHIFNGALIIAGFSTMSASLFSVGNMLVTLAEDRDAPKILGKKGRFAIPLPAFVVTVTGLLISIVLSRVMPDKVYEYFTTGASLLILYNWILILLTYSKLTELKKKEKIKRTIGLGLIIVAITGTIIEKDTRMGFFVSLAFVSFVGIVTIMMSVIRKRKRPLTKRRIHD